MPVSKHKRKGKVKNRDGSWREGNGNANLRRAINKRLADQSSQEVMGMMADMIHASDRRRQADVRSI